MQKTPEDLGELIEGIRAKHRVPALGAALIVGTELRAWGVAGHRKWKGKIPVTVEDQWHLGSCTKAMTATLIARLVARGELRWDLTMREAFPDFADQMHEDFQKVTLVQLLKHRAGLPDRHWPKKESLQKVARWEGDVREQRLRMTRALLCESPEHVPGKEFLYSNAGYIVAGCLAEKAMNDSWENLLRREVFEPLGMTSSGFGAAGTVGKEDQPWGHGTFLFMHQPIEPGPNADNVPFLGPAGTVHASLRDWSRFLSAHLIAGRGESKLLSAESFARLSAVDEGEDYACGWMLVERSWGGGQVLTHAGSNTMHFAVAWLAPAKNFAVFAVANAGDWGAQRACDDAVGALIQRHLDIKR